MADLDLTQRLVSDEDPRIGGRAPKPLDLTAAHLRSNTPLEQRLVSDDDPRVVNMPASADPWATYQHERRVRDYQTLMQLAGVGNETDPQRREQEEAKIEVSLYLSDRIRLKPRDVYLSWDAEGHSPIAEAYFKTVELPLSYKGKVKNEIQRAAKTYQALNMATKLMFSPYDAEGYKQLQNLLDSLPPEDNEAARPFGKGGGWDFIKGIPLEAIKQSPYLFDIGAAEAVGAALGAGVAAFAGPEAVPAGVTIGRRIAGTLEASRVAASQIFMDVVTMPDPETGKPLYQVIRDPEQLANIGRSAAAVYGGVSGGLQALGFEALLGRGAVDRAIQRIAANAIEKAGRSGQIRSAFITFLAKYGKNIGAQTLIMPAQEVVNQIARDTTAEAVNGRFDYDLPKANWQDYGKLALRAADTAFRSSLLFALPGSIREARAVVKRSYTEASLRDRLEREERLDEAVDRTRTPAERARDISARLEELQAEKTKLETEHPQLLDLSAVKKIEKSLAEAIKQYRRNEAELFFYRLAETQLKDDVPTDPANMTREQWLASRPPAEAQPAEIPELMKVQSPVVQQIQTGLPRLTGEQAQGAALYVKLHAESLPEPTSLEQYMASRFVKEIFDPSMAAELERQGRWGGIRFDEAGKAIFYTTTHSDFTTWVHELHHLFARELTAAERKAAEGWLGVRPGSPWSRENEEAFSNAGLAYLMSGKAPTPELAPVFERFRAWVDEVYHTVKDQWPVTDDIRKTYEGLLAGKRKAEEGTWAATTRGKAEEILFQPSAAEEEANRSFAEAVARYHRGEIKSGDVISLGDAGEVLQGAGLKGQIRVSQRVLRKPVGHRLDLEQLGELPARMNHPMAVFPSLYHKGNVTILTDLPSPLGPIVVAVRARTGARGTEILDLRTIQPKKPDSVLFWFADFGRKIQPTFFDPGKITAWLKAAPGAHSRGVLPTRPLDSLESISNVAQQILKGKGREILFQTPPVAEGDRAYDGWRLKSEDVIRSKMTGPMPAENARKMLVNAGISPEEMRWMGLDEVLARGGKVSQEQLLQAIRENGIQVVEVLKGSPVREEYDQAESRFYELAVERGGMDLQDADAIVRAATRGTLSTQQDAMLADPEVREALDAVVQASKRRGQVPVGHMHRYAQYALPGGGNYRELLLRMPARGGTAEIEALSREFGELRYKVDQTADRTERQEYFGRMEDIERRIATLRGREYRSPHWKESNVLAHVRFDDRADADGRRMLFLEEIQSDWHQQGRERGYGVDRLPDGYKVIPVDRSAGEVVLDSEGVPDYLPAHPPGYRVVGPAGEIPSAQIWITAEDAQRAAIDAINAGRVPAAPFAKTWPELSFKRMLRWAAEEGYDAVAWTTGEQQSRRYDLSKHVREIKSVRQDDGGYFLNVSYHNRDRLEISVRPEELADHVGKELADKIISSEKRINSWEGLDLHVGGEGMKAFYDKILPEIAAKLGKKWGVKVEDAEVETYTGERPRAPMAGIDRDQISGMGVTSRIVWTVRLQDGTSWGAFHTKEAAQKEYDRWTSGKLHRPVPAHQIPITDQMRESLPENTYLFQTPPKVTDELDQRRLNRALGDFWGFTERPEDAAYVLSTGQMLDWMHRQVGEAETVMEGGEPVHRTVGIPYPDLFKTDDTRHEFMDRAGAMRLAFDEDATLIESIREPSEEQFARIAAILPQTRAVDLEVSAPDGSSLGYKRIEHPTIDQVRAFYRSFELYAPAGILTQPSPHEDAVRQAVEAGRAVPQNVLDQYKDREWAKDEVARRQALIYDARKASSFEEFCQWMASSDVQRQPNEAYYRLIWDQAQSREDPQVQAARFTAAMDDATLKEVLAEISFTEGDQDTARIRALTPEMKELGNKILANQEDAALLAKVREQLSADPERWRRVLSDENPDNPTRAASAIRTAEAEVQEPEFQPVNARQANTRFIREMEAGGLPNFAADLYERQLARFKERGTTRAQRFALPRWIAVLGKQTHDGVPDELTARMAMKEVRQAPTMFREMFAALYNDEEMIRQLEHEKATGDVVEEERLRGENSKLRAQVKKMREEVERVQRDIQPNETVGGLNKELDALRQAADEARAEVQAAQAKAAEAEKALADHATGENEKAYRHQIHVLEGALEKQRKQQREIIATQWKRSRMERLIREIQRPVDPYINDAEQRMIEDIQSRVTYDPGDAEAGMLNRLREWRRQNPEAEMPPDLVLEIQRRSPRVMSFAELDQIAKRVRELRQQGRAKRLQELGYERLMIEAERGKAIKDVTKPGAKPPQPEGLGTAGQRRAYKTGWGKKTLWGTWRMNRIAEMLGPTYTRWLWDEVNECTDATLNQIRRVEQASVEKLKTLGISSRQLGHEEVIDGMKMTRAEMLGIYIYAQDMQTYAAIRWGNRIPDETIQNVVKALTPEEKQYADWMVDTLSSDADFDRLQGAMIEFNNTRMIRVLRYFPMQRRGLAGGMYLSEIAQELLEMRGYARRPRPRSGFLITRQNLAPEAQTPLRLDAPAIFHDHVNKREFFINNAVLIKRLSRIFDNRDVTKALLERYGDAMPAMVNSYIAAYTNPNIYRAVEDWGDFSRILRANYGLSLIGSNVMTMLRQLPDIPMIMIQAGPLDGLVAAARFMADPIRTIKFVREKAPQLQLRSYDRVIEELKVLDKTAYERGVARVGEAGFVVLKAMDTVTNTIGWLAMYQKTMRRTGNEQLAVKAARDFILRKRPAARAKDVAQFFRQPGLMSWLTMFGNQPNQQWNVLTYDIPHKLASGLRGNWADLWDATLNATALMVGAVGMGMISRKTIGDIKDWGKDTVAGIFGNAPFVGYDIENAIRGQPMRGGFEPISGAYETAKAITDITEGADTEKAVREIMNAIWAAGQTLGVPIQARRIYRTFTTGDPWDLVGGAPKGED